MLNVDNDVPVVHSLNDGEVAEMVLDNNKHEDSSNEDDIIVNTGEKIPIDDMVKLCDQLIGGMEQRLWDYGSLFNQRKTAWTENSVNETDDTEGSL